MLLANLGIPFTQEPHSTRTLLSSGWEARFQLCRGTTLDIGGPGNALLTLLSYKWSPHSGVGTASEPEPATHAPQAATVLV